MEIEGIVCICSRGTVFSRTMEAIDTNLEKQTGTWKKIYTHNKPIPEAQNEITHHALYDSPEWIWYVEEDMVVPDNILTDMLKIAKLNNILVVSGAYNLVGKTSSFRTKVNHGRELVYTGMGCLLVNAEVFGIIDLPWFQTQNEYSIDDDVIRKSGVRAGGDEAYGQQDIHFFYQLQKYRIRAFIEQTIPCAHLRLIKLGNVDTNNGCHVIEEI